MNLERRFLKGAQARTRKGGKPGIEGVSAVFNEPYDNGWFVERMKPGAFKRALKEKQDIRCCFNHDPNNLLARTKNGTLRAEEKEDGLHYDADVNADTRAGSDVLALVDRGDVDGCSIMFSVRKQIWSEETDENGNTTYFRDIEDVDLYEMGPVTFPAYEQTSVQARTAFWPSGVPEEVRSHVPALRSDGGETTKKVDGEQLTRKCFLLVGDPDKTDTWELPWKFSTDEKTKSHLRDALARFNQVEGFSEEALDKAWSKLLVLCDHYDIDVADKARPGKSDKKSARAKQNGCECDCESCMDGDCENCTNADCDDDNCLCSMRAIRLRARMTQVTL